MPINDHKLISDSETSLEEQKLEVNFEQSEEDVQSLEGTLEPIVHDDSGKFKIQIEDKNYLSLREDVDPASNPYEAIEKISMASSIS